MGCTARPFATLDWSTFAAHHFRPFLPPCHPQVRTALLNSNTGLTTATLEALAAGPARSTLRVLQTTELASLDCGGLPQLLPQLAALQVCAPAPANGACSQRRQPHAVACPAAPHPLRLSSAACWDLAGAGPFGGNVQRRQLGRWRGAPGSGGGIACPAHPHVSTMSTSWHGLLALNLQGGVCRALAWR